MILFTFSFSVIFALLIRRKQRQSFDLSLPPMHSLNLIRIYSRWSFSLFEILVSFALLGILIAVLGVGSVSLFRKKAFMDECKTVQNILHEAFHLARITRNEIDVCFIHTSHPLLLSSDKYEHRNKQETAVALLAWGIFPSRVKNRIERARLMKTISEVRVSPRQQRGAQHDPIVIRFFPQGIEAEFRKSCLYLHHEAGSDTYEIDLSLFFPHYQEDLIHPISELIEQEAL